MTDEPQREFTCRYCTSRRHLDEDCPYNPKRPLDPLPPDPKPYTAAPDAGASSVSAADPKLANARAQFSPDELAMIDAYLATKTPPPDASAKPFKNYPRNSASEPIIPNDPPDANAGMLTDRLRKSAKYTVRLGRSEFLDLSICAEAAAELERLAGELTKAEEEIKRAHAGWEAAILRAEAAENKK